MANEALAINLNTSSTNLNHLSPRVAQHFITIDAEILDVCDGKYNPAAVYSRLAFWCSPKKDGSSRLKRKFNGQYWVAKTTAELAIECHLTINKVKHALAFLRKKNLIRSEAHLFHTVRTNHFQLVQREKGLPTPLPHGLTPKTAGRVYRMMRTDKQHSIPISHVPEPILPPDDSEEAFYEDVTSCYPSGENAPTTVGENAPTINSLYVTVESYSRNESVSPLPPTSLGASSFHSEENQTEIKENNQTNIRQEDIRQEDMDVDTKNKQPLRADVFHLLSTLKAQECISEPVGVKEKSSVPPPAPVAPRQGALYPRPSRQAGTNPRAVGTNRRALSEAAEEQRRREKGEEWKRRLSGEVATNISSGKLTQLFDLAKMGKTQEELEKELKA